jgi:hypothetical protein
VDQRADTFGFWCICRFASQGLCETLAPLA